MDFSLSYFYFLYIILLSHFHHQIQQSKGQQEYLDQMDCNNTAPISKGYLCNGIQRSCKSFLGFRAHPPYDSPETIAFLLSSDASSIASINNVSISHKFPFKWGVIIPVTCSCWGSMYQHFAPYTVRHVNESYYSIAYDTYQGLTTCQALDGQNYYRSRSLNVGAELIVPVRCACPTQNQEANQVTALLTYIVELGENVTFIGKQFGADIESLVEANNVSGEFLVAFLPLLVPLKSESCSKNSATWLCRCPNGQFAYEMQGHLCIQPPDNNSKSFPLKLVAIIGVAIGAGFLCLALFCYNIYLRLQKRKVAIRKEKYFKQNGGLLLSQGLSSFGGGDKSKVFAAEELQKATDNFNQSRILGQGGFGTVYKGMLDDGKIVAIKKSKAVDKSQIQQFINEVVILSQINHKNIVKLQGCCLETEFPLLVYEFIPNGTLFHHIHEQDNESSLSWGNRLRIACEVAEAVAYMHSAASIPIFHRDIKSSNILLDEKYSAKVSDFGTSRSIPDDRTHLTTNVQGTFGYLDPEYFRSSQFTDKSDVYSFGVVLIELLTGEKPVSLNRAEAERGLVAYFISSMKDNKLLAILDIQVANEAPKEDIYAVAYLAVRCLRLNSKKRPTMKEVAIELEGLRKPHSCLEIHEQTQLISHEIIELTGIDIREGSTISLNSDFFAV